jgi:hypothetical protein
MLATSVLQLAADTVEWADVAAEVVANVSGSNYVEAK